MSEKVYTIVTPNMEVYKISFSEAGADDFMCLCTFPHNDLQELSADRVIALALFGAAVRLATTREIGTDGGYIYLPDGVPQWIVDALREWRDKMFSIDNEAQE